MDILETLHDSASTTNEVDDLYPIVITQLRVAPVAATHDGTIQLDGDSRRRQIKLSDKVGERKWAGEFSGFAVYVNAQRQQASSNGGMNDPAQLGGLIFHDSAHEHSRAARRELRNVGGDGRHAVAFRL